jgi:hypothetical protein
VIARVSGRGRLESQSERKIRCCRAAGLEDGGRHQRLRNAGLLEAGKGNDSLLELPEGTQHCLHLGLVERTPISNF